MRKIGWGRWWSMCLRCVLERATLPIFRVLTPISGVERFNWICVFCVYCDVMLCAGQEYAVVAAG
jgi:hypothetical protein